MKGGGKASKDYKKDIFLHLQETLEKFDRLTDEIITMRKESNTLKTENHGLNPYCLCIKAFTHLIVSIGYDKIWSVQFRVH